MRSAARSVRRLGALGAVALAASAGLLPLVATAPPAGAATGPLVAYVMDDQGVAKVDLATGQTLGIADAPSPTQMIVSPDGTTGYVTDIDNDEVTPINLATMATETAIPVDGEPTSITLSPDGTTAWVTTFQTNLLIPISLSTDTVGTAIAVGTGTYPEGIDFSPGGTTMYVELFSGCDTEGDGGAVALNLDTDTFSAKVAIPNAEGAAPFGMSLSADGSSLYLVTETANLFSVDTSTWRLGSPTALASGYPTSAIIPGDTPATADDAFVPNATNGEVIPFDMATGAVGTTIDAAQPGGISDIYAGALTPDGTTLWVPEDKSGSTTVGDLVPIDVATGAVGTPISLGSFADGIAIAYAPPLVPTTTTLSGPARVGEATPVTLTATVSADGASPAGTVTFTDGSDTLCTDIPVSNGVATCTTEFFTPGAQSVVATYSGDAVTAASTSSPLAVTVVGDEVTVATSVAEPVTGQPVTYTATVTSTARGTPAGVVTFSFAASLGQAHLACSGGDRQHLSGGVATCRVPGGEPASDAPLDVVANYAGKGVNGPATGSWDQTITPDDTTATVTAAQGAPSFTLTVAAAAPGAGTPTGTVTWTLVRGTAHVACTGGTTLSAGSATCTVAPWAVPPHGTGWALTAAYAGSSDYRASSVSATVTL